MSTPIDELALAEIASRLSAISEANGYHFTIPVGNVERRLVYSVAEHVALPAIFVLIEDEADDPNAGSNGSPLVTIPVDIVFLASAAPTEQQQVSRNMKADITQAMGVEFELLDADGGRGMVKTIRQGAEVGLATTDGAVIYTAVYYDMIYEHRWGDPYRFP